MSTTKLYRRVSRPAPGDVSSDDESPAAAAAPVEAKEEPKELSVEEETLRGNAILHSRKRQVATDDAEPKAAKKKRELSAKQIQALELGRAARDEKRKESAEKRQLTKQLTALKKQPAPTGHADGVATEGWRRRRIGVHEGQAQEGQGGGGGGREFFVGR